MKIIRPIDTACGNILQSNVTQDVPQWDIGVTYSKGDTVVTVSDTCGDVVYESLDNSNTGNDPETTPLSWLPIGTSNYWSLFDDKNSSQTKKPTLIEYVVEFSNIVDSFALININATSVDFDIWESNQDWTIDTPKLSISVDLRDYGTTSWAEYLLYEVKQKDNEVQFGIPIFSGGVGRMRLHGGDNLAIGSLVYGRSVDVGDSLYGFTSEIKDYSYKSVDEFGNRTIVEREFRGKLGCQVVVDTGRVNYIRKVLAKYRAKPIVWVASTEKEQTQIYGFYNTAVFREEHPSYATLNLELEEL
jgi:hypothetical protein